MLLCTATLCRAWNITGTRHVYWRNTSAENSSPGLDWPLDDDPWVRNNSKACYKYCHRSRQEQSQLSIDIIHDADTPGRTQRQSSLLSSTALKQCLPNLSGDKKKKFQGTCIKNKIKQIPRPQPKPTKLKFPEEAWYFAYISSSPDDSFQAIFGSSSPKVLDDTKRFFFLKKGYNYWKWPSCFL